MASEEEQAERFWQRSAAGGARNPSGWLFAAEGLKRSADLLRSAHAKASHRLFFTPHPSDDERREIFEEAFAYNPRHVMLAGYAIENLLKGLLVAAHPERWVFEHRDKLLSWPSGGHDLVQLAKEASVSLNDNEERLVDRIEVYVLWAGRYPVALKAQAMRPRDPMGVEGPATWSSDYDHQVDELYHRLHEMLREAAIARAEGDRIAEESSRAKRGPELLDELKHAYQLFEVDGIVFFRTGEAEAGLRSDSEGHNRAAVGCGGCGAHFVLHVRDQPAVICRCGTLHHAELEYNTNRMMPNVRTYPLGGG